MVGVPGRSKGCQTCLRRRLKCDETKPNCQRCRKSGYVCKGYGKGLNVRFHTFDGRAKATVTADDAPVAGRISSKAAAIRTKTLTISQDLSLIAFKSDIQYAFLFSNLVWSNYGSPWLQQSALGKMGVLALEACQAFSLNVFGQYHHLGDIEADGTQHYISALSKLSSRLHTIGSPGSADLLVPIMILLLHSSIGNDAEASAIHVQALYKVLQICGPKAFASEPLRGAFESCRSTLITIALITRTRTFLEDPEWTLGPWSLNSSCKTGQNELIDILAHVPGFLHERQVLLETGQDPMRQYLISRVKHQVSATCAWRYRWEEFNQCAAREVDCEPDYPLLGLLRCRPFTKVLVCTTWKQATEIALYNAVILALLGILWSLEPPLEDESQLEEELQSPLLLPNQLYHLEQVAIEICRVFEYQLQSASEHANESTLLWLLPIGLASQVLEDYPRMSAWIAELRTVSQAVRGYGVGANSFGAGFYDFSKLRRPDRRTWLATHA